MPTKNRVKVSIIMPCYNCESHVSIAIGSILNQTLADFELIIVNDGSIDNTALEIKRFEDSRIRYIELPKNQGNYPARNIGIKLAQGKYISMMDADDVALPNKLEIQYNYLERYTKVGAVGTNGYNIDDNGNIIGSIITPQEYSYFKIFLLKSVGLIHSTLFIRTSLIRKYDLLYNEFFRYAADYDFQVRGSKLFPIRNINEYLIQYRIHSNQISKGKRLEQHYYADLIRINQLMELKPSFDDYEKKLHLELMEVNIVDKEKFENGARWLNNLLDLNGDKKLYNQNLLSKFFESILYQNKTNFEANNIPFDQFVYKICLEVLANTDDPVLVFGYGKEIDLLLKNYSVTSIEYRPLFVKKRDPNHTIIYSSIIDNWYDERIVSDVLKRKHSLMIVDGPQPHLIGKILTHLSLFKGFDKPIIFKNIARPFERHVMSHFFECMGYQYKVHSSQGNICAIGVPNQH